MPKIALLHVSLVWQNKLWAAIRTGDVATVKEFVDNHVALNVPLPLRGIAAGKDCLALAAGYGQAEIVELLLSAGATNIDAV